MSYERTEKLIKNLEPLAAQYLHVMGEESNALQAAKFANAIALHDKKMKLHTSVFELLSDVKALQKTDEQKEVLSAIITEIKMNALVNKTSLEGGFTAIERLVGRVLSVMKRAVQKEAPNYTQRGALYNNPHKTLAFQTDQSV